MLKTIICIRQVTVDNVNTSIMYICWYGRKHPDPHWLNVETWPIKVKNLSKLGLLFTNTCILEYTENQGNDQLAAFRGNLKRLTLLTSIPNIAFKTVNCFIQFNDILLRTLEFNKTSIWCQNS